MVAQARRRAALVLDEPVAVAIAPLVDPVERGVERRAQLRHRVEVERPAVVAARDHQEQRRRVDGAVVGRVRDLPGAGELAGAQLVQDLARLGVAPALVGVGLQPREHEQRAARDLGVDHQRLAGAQQRVAAERRDVPGNARRPAADRRRPASSARAGRARRRRSAGRTARCRCVIASARADPVGVGRLEPRGGLLERRPGAPPPAPGRVAP